MYSVYKTNHRGQEKFAVKQFENKGFGDSLFDSVEDATQQSTREIERAAEDARRVASQQEAAQKQADDQKSHEDSFRGFLSDDAMRKGRQLKTLAGQINYRGEMLTKKELVERKIAEGYRVTDDDRLQSPDGSFLDAKQITKTGIDYARHLQAQPTTEADQPTGAPQVVADSVTDDTRPVGEPDVVTQATSAIASIDTSTRDGEFEAMTKVAEIADANGINPNELWRDVYFEPDGADRDIVVAEKPQPKKAILKRKPTPLETREQIKQAYEKGEINPQQVLDALSGRPADAVGTSPQAPGGTTGSMPGVAQQSDLTTQEPKRGLLKRVSDRGQTALPGLEAEAEIMERREESDLRYREYRDELAAEFTPEFAEQHREPLRGIKDAIESSIADVGEVDMDSVRESLNVPALQLKPGESYKAFNEREDTHIAIVNRAIRNDMETVAGELQEAGGFKIGQRVEDSFVNATGKVSGFQISEDGVVNAIVTKDNGDTIESDFSDLEATPELWQMTRDEFDASNSSMPYQDRSRNHKTAVREAVANGQDVPAEVLADYPDLQPKAPKTGLLKRKDTDAGSVEGSGATDSTEAPEAVATDVGEGVSRSEEESSGLDAEDEATLDAAMDAEFGQTLTPIAPASEWFTSLPQKSQAFFNDAFESRDSAKMEEAVHPSNKTLRKEFENRTGAKLPRTVKGTNEAVQAWSEGRELPQPPKKKSLAKRAKARKQRTSQELDTALDELRDVLRDVELPAGLNPKVAVAVAKVTRAAVNHGISTFAEYAAFVADNFGASTTRKLGPYIERAWTKLGTYDEYRGKIDSAGKVTEVLDEDSNSQRDDSGATATRPENLEEESPEADGVDGSRGEGASDTSGSGVVAESSGGTEGQGDVSPGSTKSGTKGVRGPARPGRGGNYRLGANERVGGSKSFAAKARYKENIAAIRLLKKLEEEGREATTKEQAELVKYVGWGGLKQVFGKGRKVGKETVFQPIKGWESEFTELRELLTDEEWTAAKGSTKNAHYTDPRVIGAMWEGLTEAGFQGGRIVEPATGSGLFFGMIPAEVASNPATRLIGTEIDPLSGGIAKQLYQDANIQVQGFEQANIPDNSVDLFISNVPFGSYQLSDRHDKSVKKASIHNFFFNKAIQKTRPGGLVAFITSRYTMDEKDASTRKYWQQSGADVVGVIRLPGAAFKGMANTDVVTDIVILQKRDPGVEPSDTPWIHRKDVAKQGYLELVAKEGGGKHKVRQTGSTTFPVNEYFAQHPDHIVGELAWTGTMQRTTDNQLNVEPVEGVDIAERVKEIISTLPFDKARLDRVNEMSEELDNAARDAIADGTWKDDHLRIEGDRIYVNDLGTKTEVAVPFGKHKKDASGEIIEIVPASKKSLARTQGLIDIFNAAEELIALQPSTTAPDAEIEAARAKLNDVYDRVTSDYGPLSDGWNATFGTNMSLTVGSRLLSLEEYNPDTGEAKKAAIFRERTERPRSFPTSAAKPEDALSISLSQRGRLDTEHVAELLGKPVDETMEELGDLVFTNHAGAWELASTYLSGNVRQKLAEAQELAKNDAKYKRNVAALEAVQPEDLTPSQISVRLGSPWIPGEYYQQFLDHLLRRNVSVRHVKSNGKWLVNAENRNGNSQLEQLEWGTADIPALEIIRTYLNNGDLTVRRSDGDGGSYTDRDATTTVQAKLTAIKSEFERWIWNDGERADALANLYNTTVNNIHTEPTDGKHLVFPGMSEAVRRLLNPHQVNAVWRKLTGGNMLLAHVVGAGKSWVMAAAAMEQKRISGNPSYKTMIAVPNHLVTSGQFAKEVLEAYPSAKILAATPKSLNGLGRRALLKKMATGNYDIVVIAHSSFGMIPLNPAFEEDFIQKQIDDLENEVRTAKQDSDRSYETELETQIANLRDRLNVMKGKVTKDTRTTYFDQLGIDSLFVDEAHEFKNLAFRTRMSRVPGVNPDGSGKAFDMWMKTTYFNNVTGEKNLMFATGTPIANAIAEMYTMQRYLQPAALQRLGLEHFDSWAASFADKVTAPEIDPAGGGMRMHTRLAQYINMPELSALFREVSDVQTAEMLKEVLKRPEIEGDTPEAVLAERNPILEEIIESLQERAKDVRSGAVDKSTDNMLNIVTDGRKAATDIRLIDPSFPDLAGSKVNLAVANVHKIWQDTAADKSTQLVWLDVTSPTTKGPFNLYREIVDKLAAKGIPREQIAVMHDYSEKTKAQLFRAMNAGEIRILLGSTSVMGTGVNVQKRLIANHHLDVPWRPDQLEQRDGRILRRGNKNKRVKIIRYISKGSFDSFMWDKIEQKSKFINAAMSGTSGRTLDARESEDMSAAEMKAAAADDPNLMNYVKTKAEVERLESERRGFLDQMSQTRRAISQAESDVSRNTQRAADYAALVSKQEAAQAQIPEKEIRGEVGGKKYSNPAEFGEAILLALADAPRASKYQSESIDYQYNGLRGSAYISFNTEADYKVGEPGNDLSIFTTLGDGRYTGTSFHFSESESGNITRLNNAIAKLKEQPEYHRLEAEKAKDKIPGLQKRLDKQWPHEAELAQQRQEFTRLAALVQQSESDTHKQEVVEKLATLTGRKVKIEGESGRYVFADTDEAVGPEIVDRAQGQLTAERNHQRAERMRKLREEAVEYEWDRTINPAPPRKVKARRSKATKKADDSGDIVESSGFFGGGKMRAKKRQGLIVPAEVQSSNPRAEAAIQRAHGVGKASLWGKMKDFGHAFKTAFRVYEFIPNNSKKFGVFVDVIRRAKEVYSHAQDEAGRIVAAMVDELEPDAYAVFERAVVLENLKASVEAGEPLRYEYESLDEITEDLKRVRKVIDANPAIQRALDTRKEEVRSLVEQLVESDMLPKAALDRTEAYYHQMVLTYARANRFGGGGRGMTQHKKAFQKRRVQGPDRLGSEYDYNSNYVESEVTWMTDAIASLRMEELLTDIKENYDTRQQKTAEAKRTNYLTLVGGPKNAKRIEELKQLMQTVRGEARDAVKQELAELDPTYQYRIDIAVAADRLAELEPDLFRGADPYDVDESNHRFWDEVRRLAHDYSEPAQKAATGFLAAVGAKERMIKETLGNKFQTWETLVGEDEAVWTPQPNNIFYPAYTVPEQIVEQFQQGVISEFNLTEDQLRQVFIMGGLRGQMVLPVEIVQQLERMEKAKPSDVVKTGASAVMARWKEWMLHAPHKIVGYSLRNITGDVDATVAGAPGITKYVTPELYTELRGYYSHRTLHLSDDLRAARDHAVLDAGMDVQEITDLHKNEAFRRLMEAAEGTGSKLNPLELAAWYRSKASEWSKTREGVLRYAAFKYFRDQLNAGTLKNYGASKIEVVDEIHKKLGVDAAASKLARDLLGDYGNITIMGDWLRSTGLSPFWSFQELNLRRYPRLMMNAWQGNNRKGVAASGAIKAAVAASRIAWVYAAMALWNMLKWPDEEDELAEYDRANPHIIFGKAPNGDTLLLRNTGAVGDVLEWAGLNSMPQHAKRIRAGQMDASDVGDEMFTDFLNKLYSSAGPAKSLVEVPMGMNAFPDVLRPRQEDRDKLLANSLGVTREYEWVKGKILGSGDSVDDSYWTRWTGLASISPQKNALSTVHAARRRYSESIGKPDSDSIYAVSKYRTILKSAENGDYEAFKRSRQKLLDEGKGYGEVVDLFMKRLEGIDPTARLANKDMDGFLEFITPKEREQLDVARRHAEDMRLLLWQWWETASREDDTKDQRQEYDAWWTSERSRLQDTAYGMTKEKYPKPKGMPQPTAKDTNETYEARYNAWLDARTNAHETLQKRQGMLKRK